MNKQLLSTLIVWLFILPSLWGLNIIKITELTPLNKIKGVVSKFECKEVNKKFNGKSLIYYTEREDIRMILFYDKKLRKKNFNIRCQELKKIIEKGMPFRAITIDTFHQVLALEVNSGKLLGFNEEVKSFNYKNSIFFNIALGIGLIMTIVNFLIWYYRGDPDKWVKSSFFQGVLYFIAILAISRYLITL